MSTIRLHGSTSGHYDVTVPAVAGTNSIDLSKLIIDTDNSLTLSSNSTFAGLEIQSPQFTDLNLKDSTNNRSWIMSNRGTSSGLFEIIQRDSANTYTTPFKINGNGYITTPQQPYFYAGGNSNTNVTGGVLQFNDVMHNIGGHYSSTTWAFTAPVTGNYLFTCSILNYPNAQTAGEIYFSVNNSGNYSPLARDFAIPAQRSITLSAILRVSANDNVRVRGTIDGYYTSGHGHFAGMLLG